LRDFTVKGVLGDVSARKLANNIIESNGTLQNKEISVDIRSQIQGNGMQVEMQI
jgi:hypothetical protein